MLLRVRVVTLIFGGLAKISLQIGRLKHREPVARDLYTKTVYLGNNDVIPGIAAFLPFWRGAASETVQASTGCEGITTTIPETDSSKRPLEMGGCSLQALDDQRRHT